MMIKFTILDALIIKDLETGTRGWKLCAELCLWQSRGVTSLFFDFSGLLNSILNPSTILILPFLFILIHPYSPVLEVGHSSPP